MSLIERAKLATNNPEAKAESKRIYDQHWREIQDTAAQERFWKLHWGPVVKAMRRAFMSGFNRPELMHASVRWIGDGTSFNYVAHEVSLYLNCEVRWNGISIMLDFSPESAEECREEGRRTASALMCWWAERRCG